MLEVIVVENEEIIGSLARKAAAIYISKQGVFDQDFSIKSAWLRPKAVKE